MDTPVPGVQSVDRRTLIALSGTALAAGCLSGEGARLDGVNVGNLSDEPLSVDVRVDRDDSNVAEATLDLAPREELPDGGYHVAAETRCSWDTDVDGEYEVAARHAGDDAWTETTLEETDDHACGWVSVEVSETSIELVERGCTEYETPCERADG